MSTKYFGTSFRTAIHYLRTQCPVPVIIMTVDAEVLKKYHHTDNALYGDCLKIRRKKKVMWRIRISRALSEDEAIECLVHEWAHAMDEYYNGPPSEIHRNSWGECYSKAHRAICYPKDQ